MKIITALALLCLLLSGCAQRRLSPEALNDPAQRDSLYALIINNHDLMKAFLEQSAANDHAKMMATHILGAGGGGGSMENCPMHAGAADTAGAALKSPYAGEEKRDIKSLASDVIEQYNQGEGMGMAKAAELNHYPGPRHVLMAADQLKLSDDQKTRTQKLYDGMHAQAIKLGKAIVEQERLLNDAFAGGTITMAGLKASLGELGRLQGELRLAHLEAHVGMKQLLSADQIRQYESLRGYGTKE